MKPTKFYFSIGLIATFLLHIFFIKSLILIDKMDEKCFHFNKKTKKTIYDSLSQEIFKERMIQSFPSIYLTMISIIQGVALGLLTQNTFGRVANLKPVDLTDFLLLLLPSIPYAIVSLLSIIAVSFEYSWFVVVYRWAPELMDTLVPFALGITEIAPIFFLDKPQIWWFLNAIFAACGTLGFINTRRNCKPSMFIGRDTSIERKAYKRTVYDIWLDIGLTFLMAILCFVMTSLYDQDNSWGWLPTIVFDILLLTMLVKDDKFINYLHNQFGYSR